MLYDLRNTIGLCVSKQLPLSIEQFLAMEKQNYFKSIYYEGFGRHAEEVQPRQNEGRGAEEGHSLQGPVVLQEPVSSSSTASTLDGFS